MSTPSDADALEHIKYLMNRTRLAETLLVLRDGIESLPERFNTSRRAMEDVVDLLKDELKRELVETPAPFGSTVEQVHGG